MTETKKPDTLYCGRPACKNCGKPYSLHAWKDERCKYPSTQDVKTFYEPDTTMQPRSDGAA